MNATCWSNRIPGLALVAALLLVAANAQANNYYFAEDVPGGAAGVRATYFFAAQGNFTANTHLEVQAIADQLDGDPVMYITRGSVKPPALPDYRWYDDDGCGGGTVNACITLDIPANDLYWIAVHAYQPESGGYGGRTFQLRYRVNYGAWQVWGSRSWPLGGYVIYTQGPVSGQEWFETVLMNDGPAATLLFRFDYDSSVGHFWPGDYNYPDGVGDASKLPGAGQWAYVLISSAAPIEGRTRFLRNDALVTDTDGDGLGDNLEIEACTCPRSDYGTLCGFPCATAGAGAQDTDGDGLRDDWELIGVDDASKPQLLPKWGASPRHKDLFVEIDRDSVCVDGEGNHAPPFTRADAEFVAARFAAATGMNNPDGIDGIAAHFDINEDSCNNEPGDIDGISAICGYFGGSQVVATNCLTDNPQSFDAVRVGKFHWAERDCSAGSSPPSVAYTSCFSSRTTLAHELGHNMGLEHWGADSAGSANNKPNYPSLMNYNYTGGRNGNEALAAFSDGVRDSINPASLREDVAFSAGQDMTFMLGEPYAFTEHGTSGSHLVDWNRDGVPDTGATRAHVTQAPWRWDANDGYDHPIMQEIEDMPDSNSITAPAGARFTLDGHRWTYVVVNDQTTHLFKYTRSYQRVGGWNLTYQNIGTTPHWSNAQPTVVEFPTPPLARLVVFGTTTSSAPQYATLNSFGVWSAWQVLPKPTTAGVRDVSAAVLGNRIYLVARDSGTSTVYFGYLDSNLAFSGWSIVTVKSLPVKSMDYTPGLAAGPEGKLYMAVKGAESQPRTNYLALYSFNPATGWWVHLNLVWPVLEPNEPVRGRPSLAFRRYYSTNGSALPSGNGAMHIWWPAWRTDPYSGAPAARPTYRWTWGQFSATMQSFNPGRWHQPRLYNASVCGDTSMNDDSGIGLVFRDAEGDMNLEAFMPHGPVGDCGWQTIDTVHVPHADGEFAPTNGRPIADFNDYPVLAANLCTSLGNSASECVSGFSSNRVLALTLIGPPRICGGTR